MEVMARVVRVVLAEFGCSCVVRDTWVVELEKDKDVMTPLELRIFIQRSVMEPPGLRSFTVVWDWSVRRDEGERKEEGKGDEDQKEEEKGDEDQKEEEKGDEDQKEEEKGDEDQEEEEEEEKIEERVEIDSRESVVGRPRANNGRFICR